MRRRGIDGLIVSNTTLARAGIERERHRHQAGGLSGRPLMDRSTWILARFRRALGPHYPLIGVGGVADARSFLRKIEAGADLVQVYTALVYAGPRLPVTILHDVVQIMDRTGASSIADFRNTAVDEVLAGPAPED